MKTKRTFYKLLLIFTIMILASIFNIDNLIYFNSNNLYAKSKKSNDFTLNFKDTDIIEFTNMMSQLIGKNIILDNQVRGKITISSARKIPISKAYDVFKSILEVKGYGIVETENLIKVIPIREAIKKATDIIVDGKKAIDVTKLGTKDENVTYLLEMKFADANEISSAIRPLKSNFMNIVVYKTLNTIIFNGNSSEIESMVKIAQALDKPEEDENGEEKAVSKGNLHIIHLENASAPELVEVLSRVPFSETALVNKTPMQEKNNKKVRPSSKANRAIRTTRSDINKDKSKLSIIASKETNSIIIVATPEEFRQIQKLVKELDTVREQVLIEALIVEVSAKNTFGFGINWMLGKDVGGSNVIGGSQILNSNNTTFEDPTGLGKTTAVPVNSGFQIGYLYDASILSYALLNTYQTDENFNILSTPQIVTIDNQEAELNVGEEIPIATNNRISDSGTTFYTYEYKSVGIKLKLTPHITKQEQVTLELYQEVNSVSDAGSGEKPPTLLKRDIKTKVTVLNNKTIVVGGLIRNNKTVSVSKVPLLGDIPLLGWLFKYKAESFQKTNLLVFITPHIITKQKDIDRVTQQKQDEQKMLRIRTNGF